MGGLTAAASSRFAGSEINLYALLIFVATLFFHAIIYVNVCRSYSRNWCHTSVLAPYGLGVTRTGAMRQQLCWLQWTNSMLSHCVWSALY